MKIIISERQQKLLTERFSEENLRKFLYSFWNSQKKEGETPHLSEDIYDVVGIEKNTPEDFRTIRPIWYRYNGGFKNLFEKLSEEVLDKTFRLVVPEIDLDTRVRVVDIDPITMGGYKYDVVDLICDVDNQGTIMFNMYNDEDEEVMVIDTIEAAYFEALSAYETGDLTEAINYHVYEYFYKLLEKYGIPIDVEVDLENFD